MNDFSFSFSEPWNWLMGNTDDEESVRERVGVQSEGVGTITKKRGGRGKTTCFCCDQKLADVVGTDGMKEHLLQCCLNEVKDKEKKFFLVRCTSKIGANLYGLEVLVPHNATFKAIDKLLRKEWMECCGHMSVWELLVAEEKFRLTSFVHDKEEDKLWDTPITQLLGNQTSAGGVYEYDMGATTKADVEIAGVYALKKEVNKKDFYYLLAQNIQPSLRCRMCRKKATLFDNEEGPQCNSCHTEGDIPSSGLYNSPRTGSCGYEGQMK